MSETDNNRPTQVAWKDGEQEEGLASLGGVEIVYTPLTEDEIPPGIAKNLAPQADNARRLLLARNLVPMQPVEMCLTLYCLISDKNQAVKDAAEDSFDDLPPNILRTMAGENLPPKVLDYIARNFYEDDDGDQILQTLVLNNSVMVETLQMLTRVGSPRVLGMIADNQARLQRDPQIVFQFVKNPRISIAVVSRVLEFARRQKLITIDEENKLIESFIGKIHPDEAAPAIEKVVEEVVDGEGHVDWNFPTFMTADFEADLGLDAGAAKIEEKLQAKVNLRELIREMSVPQKLRLAARGNMEARKILIEDGLALVAVEVLKSPRVTNTEIERAAASKTVEGEVLEAICKNAAWTRTYQVRLELVMNPKLPLQYANKLLGTLMERDIKTISKSKAVPQAVASIARQKLDAQEQRRRKRQKKKKK